MFFDNVAVVPESYRRRPDDRVFDRVFAAVRQSPLLPVVTDLMHKSKGNKRSMSWKAILTLYVLNADRVRGQMLFVDVLVTCASLSGRQQKLLGIDGKVISYQAIRRAIVDLGNALDAEGLDSATGELAVDLARKDDLLALLITMLLPSEVLNAEPNEYAIDSTDGPMYAARQTWAKSPPKPRSKDNPASGRRANPADYPKVGADGRLQYTVDPDARVGWRSSKNRSQSEMFIGADIHTAVAVAPVGQPHWARFITAMAVTPGGSDKPSAGIRVLDCITRRRGRAPTRVLGDRAYTYAETHKWAACLKQRGIEQSLDMHDGLRGRQQGPMRGTLMSDGAIFVDALPPALVKPQAFGPGMPDTERQSLINTYERRRAYSFTLMGGRKSEHPRYRGPARQGLLRCLNYPPSMQLPPTVPLSNCVPGSDCACAKTVTIRDPEFLRTQQRYLFGTQSWSDDYYRRSHVESGNSAIKGQADNIDRKSIQVRGLTRYALMLGFKMAIINMRTLDSARHHDIDVTTPRTETRTYQGKHRNRGASKVDRGTRPKRRGPPSDLPSATAAAGTAPATHN